ncbi:MAG: hypothetical protein ACYTEK_09810 [Planctomycetota bacterium]|jgi:hypothetical protein
MNESIAAENEGQAHQKPPLSRRRIAGEILGGAVAGFAMAFAVAVVTSMSFVAVEEGGAEPLKATLVFFVAFSVVYVLATAGSVYFIGSRGSQGGSFLVTLGGSLLGLFVVILLLFYIGVAAKYVMLGTVVKTVLRALVFLAPASMATLCFNLTRRYKEPPSS